MTVAPAILIDRLTKRYGSRVAVRDLTLTLRAGSVVCLLGRNGAGKSTTLNTVMGLKQPSTGEIRIEGVSNYRPEIREVRRAIGYLPEEPVLYENLTGREYLAFVAQLHRVPAAALERLERRLEAFELAADADKLIRGYSQGMKKKVAYLAATLHEPRIWVLDEPTGAMDAAAAHLVKEEIRAARAAGALVLVTTHVMELAEQLAERLVILQEGRLVYDGTLDELRGARGGGAATLESLFLELTAPGGAPLAALARRSA